MPWRNGLGRTTELARADGPDGFVWRISRAEVTQNGPFSAFPHIDRILFLLAGNGLLFDFGGNEIQALSTRFESIRFSGDAPVQCSLLDGPCRDLNIMTDRRWGTTRVVKHTADVVSVCAAATIFCALDGAWRVDGQILPVGGIAVVSDESSMPMRLSGDGVLIQADFLPHQ